MQGFRIVNLIMQSAYLIGHALFIVMLYRKRQPTPVWRWFFLAAIAMWLWVSGRFMESIVYLFFPTNNDAYGKYEPIDGGNTRDRVFLLSYGEAWEYLSSDYERRCAPTDYAKEQHTSMVSRGQGRWWLRSPGGPMLQRGGWCGFQAQVVNYDGIITCHNVSFCVFVRPALWVNLESGVL